MVFGVLPDLDSMPVLSDLKHPEGSMRLTTGLPLCFFAIPRICRGSQRSEQEINHLWGGSRWLVLLATPGIHSEEHASLRLRMCH